MGPRFLMVDDDESQLRLAKHHVGKQRLLTASAAPEAARLIATWPWLNGMAIDLHLPEAGAPQAPSVPNATGMLLLRFARERDRHVPLALHTGYDDRALRREAAALDAEYLVKNGERRVFDFQRRCSTAAAALPPLPPVITSEGQLHAALVHWVARTIATSELSFSFGQLLFVHAEGLAWRARLPTVQDDADMLAIKKSTARNRRSALIAKVRVHSVHEIFHRICYHAGLDHCFTDSPDRMGRVSGTAPKHAHGQNPLAPRPGDDEGR